MANLKYYNSETEEWETLVIGKQGPTGPQGVPGNDGALSPNAIINGAFDIWQRGTSITASSASTYTADRWALINGAFPTGSYSVSRQTFTPGAAPVAGYEGQFFLRYNVTTPSGTAFQGMVQKIEDVRTFAGQTVTLSFWAKADAARTITPSIGQDFGSGGSSFNTNMGSAINVTTSWARYTQTFSVASVTGKTIGANSNVEIFLNISNAVQTVDIWGVQLEAGPVATPFRRNAPSIQAELAACQRYYWRRTAESVYQAFGHGFWEGGSVRILVFVDHPVTMRTTPTSIDWGGPLMAYEGGAINAVTGVTIGNFSSRTRSRLNFAVSSNGTYGISYEIMSNNSTDAFIGFSAEL
jgi:hypothetical protein